MTRDLILTFNTGSSTIKLGFYALEAAAPRPLASISLSAQGLAGCRPRVYRRRNAPDNPGTAVREFHMGIGDKIENAKDQVVGKAKEAAGDATDNERMQTEGSAQRFDGKVGEKVEDVKDAANDLKR